MKTLLLALFLSIAISAISQPVVMWQIGQKDQSAAEFAMGPYDYSKYSAQFKHGALFEIGKDTEKESFPFVLPGPNDAWAGNSPKQLVIRFGIKELKPGKANIDINYVEVHPSSPVFQITINDYVTNIKTPPGNNISYFQNKRTRSRNLSTTVEIPENTLKQGENIIVIKSTEGSWAVFDNLCMTTEQNMELSKIPGGIYLLGADAKPALIYGKDKSLLQEIIVSVANWDKPKSYDLTIDGESRGKISLNHGLNSITTSIPEVKSETYVDLFLSSGQKVVASHKVKLFPVKHWTVHLIQHTHTDIGYTRPQTEILAEHLRYIDYAIEFCELTENYPDDARFRWVCEASWAVREYFQNRPKEQLDKFLKYIKNGQLEVTAMFFNMSEIVDENSLKTFLEPVREFKKMGIPVTTAMQNDVNGIAWCLADYMPDLGIKYVSMGEHGHRALIPFDKPTVFKWESPSGKQIYSYRADHYMTANGWGIDKVDDYQALATPVFNYLSNLDTKDYPFDAVAVQYSGYFTDNSPPSIRENKIIKDWNEKYATPKLRSSLCNEFMDYITEKYDDILPTYRVAYPDWWTDGFGSATRETAASRRTHVDMITNQGMLALAVLKGQKLPAHIHDKIRHTHENLLFYDEHTFGAAESISDPTCENSQIQWAEKASYVWEALKNAQMLYETSAGLLQSFIPRGETPTVTFYNTLNWERSGMIELYIDHEIIPQNKGFKMIDESGNQLHTQALRSRSEGTYYAIYAERIPPMGHKTYKIITEESNRSVLPSTALNNDQIENKYFKITFDSQSGSIKNLYDKELSLEMVDSQSPWQLGAFVYETLGNRQQMERFTLTDYDRKGLSDVKISAGVNGPVYQSVNITGKSACCEPNFGVKIEMRLFHHEKRIELGYAIKKLPITNPEGIYVAFPFMLDNAKLYFDVQGGVVSSGENQLEATASDWNTVQNFVSARNDKAQFIVGSNLIPLVQLGGICTGQYQRKKVYDVPHVYSWVANNYWTTNFKASQEGELRWSYYLTSAENTSNTLATRFGWGSRVPMYARVIPAGKPNNLPTLFSAFKFNNDNFLMTSATPSVEEGYIVINVRELDGKETTMQILSNNGQALEFDIVNAIEENITEKVKDAKFAPYANIFIKLKI